jgi:preprotein translocase subunit SecA
MMELLLRSFTRIFGSRNERVLRSLVPLVQAINAKEPEYQGRTDAELRAETDRLRARLRDGAGLEDLLVDSFALVREMSVRTPAPGSERGLRHYDVQLLGGIVLHQGKIAEMATGEGKTLVATAPAYLNALTGKGVHIVTVNEYLARRDREWMGPIFERLGLTVGVIHGDSSTDEKRQAYKADITYGTNNEFGFDYLRDNMKLRLEDQVQRRNYAIVDEVDNILIDEARTPLIISGPSEGDVWKYPKADQVARRLRPGEHFEVKEKEHQVLLTEAGIEEAQRLLGVDSFYAGRNMEWPHLLEQSLRAHHLYKLDVDYVVQAGEEGTREVIIVDEFTGRLMPGRRWSDGLHQAVEAKEKIPIRAENQTLATITFQNFFKLYSKLAGMTGTAMTEAGEFLNIYKLDVVSVPPNRPCVRRDENDLIYATEKAKFTAVVDDILARHGEGRPVLVGTTSIEKSERLSEVLTRRGIAHEVLNAKQHAREAEIVAKAGQEGRVTIATNMAGRGTDIKLGPGVTERGGLHIIGTERHEARRIDNQLRGRAGRQGDPGSTRFYLSLQDDLMRRFTGPRMAALLGKLGLTGDQAIESRMVTRAVERAQKKVEERNFDIRKRLLEYDEVMNEQRTLVYQYRQQILRGEGLKELVLRMLNQSLDRSLDLAESGEVRGTFDPKVLEDWWRRKVGQEPGPVPGRREEAAQALAARIQALYEERERTWGPELSLAVARYLLLNAFDGKWKEHLFNMDALKSGIGLRAYAQEDPKVAYKKEGYALFETMLRAIEEEVSDFVFRIDVGRPSAEDELRQTRDNWQGQLATKEEFGGASGEMDRASKSSQGREAPKPFRRVSPKVGRNDDCPCGSGRKYKKCCGADKRDVSRT